MPPKSAGGKRKGKAAAPEEIPSLPVPRILAEAAPIDGVDGNLGIESLAISEKLEEVSENLLKWRISEALRLGSLELDLTGAELLDLPDEVHNVPWVQVLVLAKNRLANSVFDDLYPLTSIRALNLSLNQLNSFLPASSGNLSTCLEELCLDSNIIEEIHPSMAVYRSLTWFSARKNLLSSFPGSCLGSWSKLVHLDLRDNKLTSLPAELGECLSLEDLLVSHNELTELPASVGNLQSLQLLHAQNNKLTALPEDLGRCTKLKEVDLSFNQIAELPGNIIASLTSLVKVLAPGNALQSLPAEIGSLAALEVINVSSNPIGAIPDEMGSLARLREFYANNTNIASLPDTVVGWTGVVEVYMRNTKLKALQDTLGETWTGCKTIDVRGKKKDTCKVSEVLKDALHSTRMLGVVIAKSKKAKK